MWHQRPAVERRLEHGAVPDLWLLRKKAHEYSVLPVTYVPVRVWTEAPPHQPEWDGTVDPAACEVLMRDDERCREETYQAALLCDAMRFASAPTPSTPHSLYYQNGLGRRVVCPRTIPPLQSRIIDLVFLQAINTVKDPVTKLLNKAVNQRCMIRKFGKVALDVFKTSDEAVVTLRLLLLTSLLGNYEHARPSSRPDPGVRAWLYKTFEGFLPDVWQTSFHLRLYTVAPHLMLFVLREYLVYALDDDPALKAHYNTFANFDRFKTTVVQCMDEVRVWFARNIQNERSSLHAALWHPNRPAEVQYITKKPDWDEAHFFTVLNDTILTRHHEALLKLSYKRPKDTIVTLLHGMRTAIPMVRRPGCASLSTEEADDAMDEEPAVRDPDAMTTLDLRPFVPPKQLEALNKIADGAMATFKNTALALVRSLDALECCGISPDTTQHVKRLIRDMQSGVMNTKQYTQQLKALQKTEPHAYNLIQTLVELFREKQRVRIVCTLPVRYMQNQLKALKQRYGLKLHEPYVLKETVHFVYCPVCDSVYSLLRDFSSSYINSYGYGLRDAVVSYTSDKLYCKRSKVNHRGRCADQELVFIPLLGKMLHYQGKNIILCPQPNCGMPMVLDPKRCVWTEHGPSCYDCTFRHNMARLEYQVDFMTRCALCFVDITRSETLFLYPHGVTLCQKHHRRYPQLQVELQTPENIIRCADRANTIQVIYNYHKMRKAERMRANQGYIAWALKRSRMQTRSRKK